MRKELVLWSVLILALATVVWAKAVVDTTGVTGGGLGGGLNEKDLLVLAIPALVWILKKTVVPTDPATGKVLGQWKKLLATLPVILALAYTWYRTGEISIVSSGAGLILGATILGGRNWLNKIRGK